MNVIRYSFILFFIALLAACQNIHQPAENSKTLNSAVLETPDSSLQVGAERLEAYLPLLRGKSVAIAANATSRVGQQHLIDALLQRSIEINKVFAPEHGFRGEQDAGETVDNHIDAKTGIEILSLYGRQKKPSPDTLEGIDVMVFDIQDVGVRFYTYLSTLHYVMEACAENDIPLILLDRPNPNGAYIDGPVLKPDFTSFVGLHPVPLVYGMTIGEYGQMINGEGWLKGGIQCDLTVVKIKEYGRNTRYDLPVKPSPNLPNMRSIYLYPSLALFEGTVVSIGRGTNFPFQVVGHPAYAKGDFTFTPKPGPGAMTPKLEGQLCRGIDLRSNANERRDMELTLEWLIEFYNALPDREAFFLESNFFNKLAGNDVLMAQIKSGLSAAEIKQSWQADLAEFKSVREKYLLYK